MTATNAVTRTTTPPAIAYGHQLLEVERTGDRLGFAFVRPDARPPRFSFIATAKTVDYRRFIASDFTPPRWVTNQP
ncbi:MAG: hypothetical protein ACYDB4_16965 [Candidatus Dormibacteraceae bacterium]